MERMVFASWMHVGRKSGEKIANKRGAPATGRKQKSKKKAIPLPPGEPMLPLRPIHETWGRWIRGGNEG